VSSLKYILAIAVLVPVVSQAAFQCSGYRLSVDGRGYAFINGEQTTSQKIKFLGAQGDYSSMKMDMGLMPARDGNNYGFEFVKRNGKAFLNVQLLQNSMDAPKIIGSFPCKKVSG
jgi:hypothetical protein